MKIKPLTKEQILISVDRLTRFKQTQKKYLRVFYDLILHNLIEPRYSKIELETLPLEKITFYAQEIINQSLEKLGIINEANNLINKKICEYEKNVFVIDGDSEKLLNNDINYAGVIKLFENNLPINLKWLEALSFDDDIKNLRKKNSFKFPIEKVVLAEGITEETLLPEFAKLCNYDFDKEGVFIIAAGGKNQVVKLYYEIADILRLPIFVLLDNDGEENAKEISTKLRSNDKIHIIKCGEFEDLLPESLFQRALAYELENISLMAPELDKSMTRVQILEQIFKTRGMHELKKAEFAQTVKKCINSYDDISQETFEIIEKIRTM